MSRAMNANLVWVCDLCELPIADGKGAVFVRFSERKAYRDGQANLKRKGKVLGAKIGRRRVIISAIDLMDAADAAPWRAMHHKCDTTPGDCAYWFDVARIRTLEAVLDWTRHLMGKAWLDETAWDDLIGRVLHGPINSAARDEVKQ